MSTGRSSIRLVLILSLVLVPLTGCSSVLSDAPDTQEEPITLMANNSANATHTAEVFLVDESTTIYAVRNDGLNDTREIPVGSLTQDAGDGYYYIDVDPRPARLVDNLTVPPNQTIEQTVRDRPVDTSFLIVAYDEDGRIQRYFIEDCSGYGYASVEVNFEPHGVFVDALCR